VERQSENRGSGSTVPPHGTLGHYARGTVLLMMREFRKEAAAAKKAGAERRAAAEIPSIVFGMIIDTVSSPLSHDFLSSSSSR
jgi:hypothetical protein